MEYKLTFEQYNNALKERKLLGLKCQACGAIITPPKMVCPQCAASDFEITQLKGNGKIKTFTSVYVASEGRESECPYVIVLVELDEGPWIMGNLAGVEPAKASMELVDKKVKMEPKVFPGDKYSAGDSTRPLFSVVS